MVQGGVLDWQGGATTCNLLCAYFTASFDADKRISAMQAQAGCMFSMLRYGAYVRTLRSTCATLIAVGLPAASDLRHYCTNGAVQYYVLNVSYTI